jgi:hypothetical protein
MSEDVQYLTRPETSPPRWASCKTAAMDSDVELHLRQLIFQRLADIVADNGVVSRAELEHLQVGDQQWRIIDSSNSRRIHFGCLAG